MRKKIEVPIKSILIESGILDNLLNVIKSKFLYFSNKFKYLNKKEFEMLLEVVYIWYYLNHKFPDNLEKKDPDLIKLFEKIKTHNTWPLPKALYRGLSFKSKKDLDNFLKESKRTNKIIGRIFRHNEDTRYTAWSSSKEVAETFLPNGSNSFDGYNYGCLLKIDPKDLKNENIIFSMSFLLHNEKDIKDFMEFVLKSEYEKNLKYVRSTPSRLLSGKMMFGYQHGTVFSITEEEFILSNVPFDKCNITEIKDKQ